MNATGAPSQTMGLDLLLGQLCTTDTVVRGRQFELVVTFWLRADPSYGPTMAKVWRWEDWPGTGGQRDTGIDLVVETTDGQLWAVQCKGYAATTTVTKAHLDSFLARSDDRRFSRRLLVASTDLLSGNARAEVDRERDIPLTVVGLAELQAAKVAWPGRIDDLLVADPRRSLRAARRELRQHQNEAVADVVAELDRQKAAGANDARTTLVMACGSGKTLTCHGVHEKIDAGRTLVLAPSLSLLAQLVREWAAQSAEAGGLRIAVVCSDATVAGDDLPKVSSSELPVPVTTDPDTLRTFLTDHVRDELPVVVFSTYHSSPVVAAAQKAADAAGTPVPFDLVVADEAHYLAGRPADAFATVLHDARVHAVRRVFATATPRVVSANVKARAADLDDRVVCMDDPALFGPVAHRLTFGRAIELGLLADYHVLVLGVEQTDDDGAAADAVTERHLVQVGDHTTDAASFAALTALGTAWREHNVRTAISFHSRVEGARQFAELVTATAGQPLLQFPASVQASHVSGAMPAGKRAHLLRKLTAESEDDRLRLLANARCLTAGVDVPSLDAVVFVDPRRSATDVVQAVGRALRVADGKQRGLIILPVVLRPGQDPDEALSTSAFDTVWQVLGALREHDETLAEELDSLRTALGAGGGVTRGALGKIVIDMPVWRGEDLAARLRARIIERTTSGFFHALGKLRAYADEHGHARVPTSWVTTDGFKLGGWVGRTRNQRGQLSADRMALLEALPGWVWGTREADFAEGLEKLRAYADEHGHARVTASWVTADGFQLGGWVSKRRNRRRQLSADRVALLEALPGWAWDAREDSFAEGLEKLRAYADENGHARVPQTFVTADGFKLGAWVANRRSRRGQLSADRVALLEALPGWAWDPQEADFAEGLEKLRAYADENGHARVPLHCVTDDGFQLGGWVGGRRSRRGQLSADRVALLEALPGWAWDPQEADFAEGLEKLRAYADENGHARVPQTFVTAGGFRLGTWVNSRRRRDQLSADRVALLEALPGWAWDPREDRFAEGLEKLRAYADEHGHARVPQTFVTADGFRLGTWVNSRRGDHRRGQLGADRLAQLEALPGWAWDPQEADFAEGLEKLRAYVDEHGHARVPASWVTADGFKLGNWVQGRRSPRRALGADRVAQLEALPGWVWDAKEDGFAEGLEKLRAYADENGHARVPVDCVTDDGFKLGRWVANRRSRRVQLGADRVAQLEALSGWVWDAKEDGFAEGLEKLRAYADEHGHARVPTSWVTADGFKLGGWVGDRRSRRGQLSADRMALLETVPGWVWDAQEAKFAEGLEKLRAYADENGHARVPLDCVTDDGFKLGNWVGNQRSGRRRGQLGAGRAAQLEKVPGWVWDARR